MLAYRKTRVGWIGVEVKDGAVTQVFFAEAEEEDSAPAEGAERALLDEAFRQLAAYLEGRLTVFSLPVAPDDCWLPDASSRLTGDEKTAMIEAEYGDAKDPRKTTS